MDNQRIRNLTTGKLHTDIGCIYQDIEFLTGEKGIMTHQLHNAYRALGPYLREKITDQRFWDGQYDPTHTGETNLKPMNDSERAEMWKRYAEMPSLLAGKKVIVVEV